MLYLYVFLLASFFAYLIHKSRFCTMGALSDLFAFGGIHRLQLLVSAMVFGIIGTQFLLYFSLINQHHLPYSMLNIPWFTHLLGGFIFGIGMMLASGCPTQQCIHLGQGNLKAVFSLPLIAIAAQIALSGILAPSRLFIQNLSFFNIKNITIQPLIGIIIGVSILICVLYWISKNSSISKSQKINIILYSCAIGLVTVTMWYIAGHLAFIEQDEATLDYSYIGNSGRTIQSLSMILPLTYLFDWLMYGSDTMRILNLNVMLIVGLITATFCIGVYRYIFYKQKFSIISFKNPIDFIHYIAGSIFMGFGGAIAMGCSIGQGLSAISTLSIGAIFSLIGIFLGAKLAYKYI